MSKLNSLKQCIKLNDIAELLGYRPKALSYILYKIPDEQKYETFFIPKKYGGLREICAPNPRLKEVQRRLAALLDECLLETEALKKPRRSLSHAFRKKHSIVSNAEPHTNKRYVLNIDLNNFFPSINFGRVRGFFIRSRDFNLNPDIATIIAQIACHKNQLPQGSPCSPVISNLIGNILDGRLVGLAKKYKCTYSRYADDLTFSTNEKKFPTALALRKKMSTNLWKVGDALEKTIIRAGFVINKRKTRMQYKTSRQDVTGLIVNKK